LRAHEERHLSQVPPLIFARPSTKASPAIVDLPETVASSVYNSPSSNSGMDDRISGNYRIVFDANMARDASLSKS
jgi:hypothetical protein